MTEEQKEIQLEVHVEKTNKAKTFEPFIRFAQGIWDTLSFSFSSACQNIWRHKLLSITSVIITIVTLTTVYFSIGINFVTNYAISYIGKFVDLNVPLYENVTQEQIDALINEVSLLPYTEEITFKSKEEALVEFQQKYKEKLPNFLETYNLSNPLPNFLIIKTKNPEDQKKLITVLTSDKFSGIVNKNSVSFDTDYGAKVDAFTQNTQKIEQSTVIMSIAFIILSLLIVIATLQIALYHRSKDLKIMRIVGASNAHIQIPFMFEAILIGLGAFILSFIPFAILKNKLTPFIAEQFNSELSLVESLLKNHFLHYWGMIILGIVVFHMAISFIVTKRYLASKIKL